MIMRTYFTITAENEDKTKYQTIQFMISYDEDGELVDGLSYNPITGWTNYTAWMAGWSEPEPKENILLKAVKEFSLTAELNEIVEGFDYRDIDKSYHTRYDCGTLYTDYFSAEGCPIDFTVTCTDIEYEDED